MREQLIYTERKNTSSLKWDYMDKNPERDDTIPLWVADMDFKAPKAVIEALQQWVDVGAFGYYKPPEAYYNSFINWEKKRHGAHVSADWIRYAPSIVAALFSTLSVMSGESDNIIMLKPVYNLFDIAVDGTGRKVVGSQLINENGVYSIDFKDFEEQIIKHKPSVFIHCSPHNPVGRVWTEQENKTLIDICKKHNVRILSDEIHQDLIMGDKPHVPLSTLGDDSIVTLASASKTFNLAGLQNAFVIIPDPTLREKFDAFTTKINIRNGNMAGYIAVRAAFEHGEGWLESLIAQVKENYATVKKMADEIEGAVLSPLEGTYLAWLDLRACLDPGKTKEIIRDKCAVAPSYGEQFGGEDCMGFLRLNLATKNENVAEACRRIKAELVK